MFYYVHVNFLRRHTNKSLLFLCQARNVTIGAAAAALAAMHDLVYLIQFKDAYDLSRVKCFGFRTKISLGSRVSLVVLHRSLSVKLGVSGLTCELPEHRKLVTPAGSLSDPVSWVRGPNPEVRLNKSTNIPRSHWQRNKHCAEEPPAASRDPVQIRVKVAVCSKHGS